MKKKHNHIPGLIVSAVILSALLVFLSIWWFGASYPYYETVAKAEAEIPGLSDGLSPQGLCPLPENDMGYDFAMSGYIDGSASRVYLIDKDGDAGVKYVNVTKDGVPLNAHFGGVACTDSYMWIASDELIVRVALTDLFAASYGSRVEIKDSFAPNGMLSAFCAVYNGELYVGEFYRPGNYETELSHHIQTAEGTNHAFIYVYTIDEEAEGGIALKSPSKIISIPDLVQGIAITKDHIFLSTSYGLPDSTLYIFANTLSGEPNDNIALSPEMSSTRPLYILDPAKGGTMRLPCMSEELFVKDGRLYILFESLSKKYRFFTRTRETHIISIAVDDVLDIDVKQ